MKIPGVVSGLLAISLGCGLGFLTHNYLDQGANEQRAALSSHALLNGEKGKAAENPPVDSHSWDNWEEVAQLDFATDLAAGKILSEFLSGKQGDEKIQYLLKALSLQNFSLWNIRTLGDALGVSDSIELEDLLLRFQGSDNSFSNRNSTILAAILIGQSEVDAPLLMVAEQLQIFDSEEAEKMQAISEFFRARVKRSPKSASVLLSEQNVFDPRKISLDTFLIDSLLSSKDVDAALISNIFARYEVSWPAVAKYFIVSENTESISGLKGIFAALPTDRAAILAHELASYDGEGLANNVKGAAAAIILSVAAPQINGFLSSWAGKSFSQALNWSVNNLGEKLNDCAHLFSKNVRTIDQLEEFSRNFPLHKPAMAEFASLMDADLSHGVSESMSSAIRKNHSLREALLYALLSNASIQQENFGWLIKDMEPQLVESVKSKVIQNQVAQNPELALSLLEVGDIRRTSRLSDVADGLAQSIAAKGPDQAQKVISDILLKEEIGNATNSPWTMPAKYVTGSIAVQQGLDQASAWVATLPEGPEKKASLETLFAAQLATDPHAASLSLTRMQPGETKDNAIAQLVDYAESNPEATIPWINEVVDPTAYKRLIAAAVEQLTSVSQLYAREVLRNSGYTTKEVESLLSAASQRNELRK